MRGRRGDDDRAGAVAEEDAGLAVGVVGDSREAIGADDEDALVHAALDARAGELHGVAEARAAGGDIHRGDAGLSVETELGLEVAGG